MREADVLVIGAGPAGLAAATAAKNAGARNVLILEREAESGGILNQCIHNGFGLHVFNEELTGPEYAHRVTGQAVKSGVQIMHQAMVTTVSRDLRVTAVVADRGVMHIQAKAVVLAMGCRERPRGALRIPGARCSGIYAAGAAQKLLNIHGFMPGKEVVVLGSGDIGLIMARRMVLEGARVHAVAELMPFSGGLTRNIVQCLDDYNIPLLLSHTVVNIHGKGRLKGVTLARVGEDRRPVMGSQRYIPCDTLLLSVGLIPENELSQEAGLSLQGVTQGVAVDETMMTDIPGIFSCGNVLHVHDLVDFVTMEGTQAGENAAKYAQGGLELQSGPVRVRTEGGIRYCVPQTLHFPLQSNIPLRMRVDNIYRNVRIEAFVAGACVAHMRQRIVTPGEMQTLTLKKDAVPQAPLDGTLLLRMREVE